MYFRRFFVAILLLLVFVSVVNVIFWIRSYRSTDVWEIGQRFETDKYRHYWLVACVSGHFCLESREIEEPGDRWPREPQNQWPQIPPRHWPQWVVDREYITSDRRWGLGGVDYLHRDLGIGTRQARRSRFDPPGVIRFSSCLNAPFDVVRIPFYVVVLVTALPPAIVFSRCLARKVRQRHRLRNNLCLDCGYDLRASKDRCPECGKPIVSADSPSKNLRI
jgi:hypothetical protein